MLPESDDEGSEEEAIKPVKKPKTTKTGMNFENLPTKRKHAEEEETSHVKKQKTTEEIKRPILVSSSPHFLIFCKVVNQT